MKRLQRAALLTELIAQMRAHDSWCGETHVQKGTYVLEELLGVDIGYDFTLCKHGPFSFDLRDELEDLASDGVIRYVPQPPYGPRIAVDNEAAERVRRIYPKTLARYRDQIAFVAEKLDARGVVDLERLATALYVTRTAPNASVENRARMLSQLKPHVPERTAIRSVQELDEIRGEARGIAA
jgi:hypothetical protein